MILHVARMKALLGLTLLLSLNQGLVGAAQKAVPAEQQAFFLLKAISKDHNLAQRLSGGIHIAILYRGDQKTVSEIVAAFNNAEEAGLNGASVKATGIEFKSVAKLLKQIVSESIDFIYIPSSLFTALSSIQQVTRGKKIPSLCASKKLVEQGVALGIYMLKNKPKLAINLRAAKVEGLKLKAGVLTIATVIK